MAELQARQRTVYYAPTRGRHYQTRMGAARGEAAAMIRAKYPDEDGEEADGYYHWHWRGDERLVRAWLRLARWINRAAIREARET